jgi:glucose/arabinose dehydrogenase
LGLIAIMAVAIAYISPGLVGVASIGPLTVADGFQMNIFADETLIPEWASVSTGPFALAFDSNGRLFASTGSGKILILLDNNEDGVVDQVKTFASDLGLPLGLAFRPTNGDLFCTSNPCRLSDGTITTDCSSTPTGRIGRILRLRDTTGSDTATDISTIIDGLPSDGDHQTNRLKFGPDGLLYFGQGSRTDDGQPGPSGKTELPLNAKILSIDVDNPGSPAVFGSGLRNPFGMAFDPASGALFATAIGSGELDDPDPFSAPLDGIDQVAHGKNYGFPGCEGVPDPANPACAGVTGPVITFIRHITPTSLAFYTGPQAGDSANQLLVTLFKRLQAEGGDLRRFTVTGDASSGFKLTEVLPRIAEFGVIDPGDGPVDTAIDPISGDIYVARLDTINKHPTPEHHNIIFRIHRAGSDSMPFIGTVRPTSLKTGSGPGTVSVIGRHLKPGAVVMADGAPLVTHTTNTRFELAADVPAGLTSTAHNITIQVQNPDGRLSNSQTLAITGDSGGPPAPQLASFTVEKRSGKVIQQVVVGMKAKKLILIADGSNFDAGAQLLVNGNPLLLESAGATELIGAFTPDMVAQPGNLTLQVRNSTSKVSNTLTLSVASQ